MSIERAIDGVIGGATKLGFFGLLTAVTFGGERVEAQVAIKENQ